MKIKVRKNLVLKIVIALVISFAVVYTLYGRYVLYAYMKEVKKDVKQMQVRLLCETDHQALLEACNELSQQVAEGNLKPGRYNIRRDRHPLASRFPQPILDLAPSYVYIDENDSGRVMVEMMGGLGHFGVEAYTEDYKKPSFVGFKFGDRELIPRLWYYDDGYIDNPKYDKRIEALMKKSKKAK
jgi:hypothetical protein